MILAYHYCCNFQSKVGDFTNKFPESPTTDWWKRIQTTWSNSFLTRSHDMFWHLFWYFASWLRTREGHKPRMTFGRMNGNQWNCHISCVWHTNLNLANQFGKYDFMCVCFFHMERWLHWKFVQNARRQQRKRAICRALVSELHHLGIAQICCGCTVLFLL